MNDCVSPPPTPFRSNKVGLDKPGAIITLIYLNYFELYNNEFSNFNSVRQSYM